MSSNTLLKPMETKARKFGFPNDIRDSAVYMGYQDQLERTRRWLKRLENASSYSSNDINNSFSPEKHDEYEDYLYAFFQNCWHVKDWILGDTGAPQRLQEAVRKVDEQGKILPLMLCSGVANGSKHLRQGRDRKRHAKT
jgi:hypothetical protein